MHRNPTVHYFNRAKVYSKIWVFHLLVTGVWRALHFPHLIWSIFLVPNCGVRCLFHRFFFFPPRGRGVGKGGERELDHASRSCESLRRFLGLLVLRALAEDACARGPGMWELPFSCLPDGRVSVFVEATLLGVGWKGNTRDTSLFLVRGPCFQTHPYGCGSKPFWYHFGGFRCTTHFRTYLLWVLKSPWPYWCPTLFFQTKLNKYPSTVLRGFKGLLSTQRYGNRAEGQHGTSNTTPSLIVVFFVLSFSFLFWGGEGGRPWFWVSCSFAALVAAGRERSDLCTGSEGIGVLPFWSRPFLMVCAGCPVSRLRRLDFMGFGQDGSSRDEKGGRALSFPQPGHTHTYFPTCSGSK